MSIDERTADDSDSLLHERILRETLGDRVFLPGDSDFDRFRTPWNLTVDQMPAAIVCPSSVEEVIVSVRVAREAGLRVAPQATGHAAAALARTGLAGTMLLNLSQLCGVSVDPRRRTATVIGGTTWNEVIAACAPYGLTALHGSAGSVSAIGYSLSGGLSFYAREHGLGVRSVREIQLVTARGALVQTNAQTEPDLFWALRGGVGSFGVVVSMEIDLLDCAEVYAGMLLWDDLRAREVAHAWVRWAKTAPEWMTSTLRVLHLPPLPQLPPFLRGRSVVVIDGAAHESDEQARSLLEPLRALGPEVDTFARIPAAEVLTMHMDPPEPTPALTAHAVLRELPDQAVDAFVDAAAEPSLFFTELRQLGGAISRTVPSAGAVSAIAGDFLVHAVAIAPVVEAVGPAEQTLSAAIAAFAPWRSEAVALTFVDGSEDPDAGFGSNRKRLREIRQRFDPEAVFVAARPV